MAARLEAFDLSVDIADHERRFTVEVPGFSLGSAEIVGLNAPSGSGKTLMLEVLGLLRRPSRAQTFHIVDAAERVDLTGVWSGKGLRAPELRSRWFGYVPQSGSLLPFLNVVDNITLSQRIAGREDAALVKSLIDRLGLGEVAYLRPEALSIGQRQRVAIGRALAHRPSFVIADEPTAALDPETARTAMGLLIDAATTGGAGVLVSSHDLPLLDLYKMRRVSLAIMPNSRPNAAISRLSEQETTLETAD